MLRTLTAPLVAVLLSLLLGAVPSAAAAPATAARAAADLDSSIWLPYWATASGYQRISRNRDLFGTTSPFWYDAVSCGRVSGHTGAGERSVVRKLRRQGLSVVPSVTATGLTPRKAIRCFGDAARLEGHLDALIRVVRSRGYAGLDFDYEHLALTTKVEQARRVRRAFSRFVEAACLRLRSIDKQCVVTVMPRTADALSVWRDKLIPGVYDYRAIGSAATRVRVMAYDQHASTTAPGPMAGFGWVRSIVDYAASTVPAARLELGVPTYGRVWARGTAVALTGDQAKDLARRHGKTPRWDQVQREMTFRFRAGGARHTVWFSSPRSVAARAELAAKRGLAGAAYWAAGLEPTGTWRAVRVR